MLSKLQSPAIVSALFLLSLSGASFDSSAESISIELNDSEGNPIENGVVEILLPENLQASFQGSTNVEVDQFDKEFVPHVSAVVVGNQVSFPNSDDILHHVYSFSPLNTFNIPLYGKNQQKEYSQAFDQTGVVEIGCNIHDWMLAYVYVAETSLNGITNSAGLVKLTDLPTGEFQLRIWHPRLADEDVASTRAIEVVQGQDLDLQISLQLQRDRRVRRAPSSKRSRYR